MSVENCTRGGCKDVFHAFMVKNAVFSGELEFPCVKNQSQLPNRLVSFSKAVGGKDYNQWVHFYEDDADFERLWNHPNKYLPILQRYCGVISPDFSLYRDMPLVMQEWNTYRNRAVAHWLQENGIPVIPNIRWGDERSFSFCCDGIDIGSTIAIGSHGCIKQLCERRYFKIGLDYVVNKLCPQAIIVYGLAPDSVFGKYRDSGIRIIQFDSEYMLTHQKVVGA
jgi:hypothetical protein